MKRMNITLTDGHFKALKKISEKSGFSMSDLIRRALDSYFIDMFEWYEGIVYGKKDTSSEEVLGKSK